MNYFSPDSFSWFDYLIRMGAAVLLPFLLGLERYLRRKPIDFWPFVIISVGACALVLGIMEFTHGLTDSQIRVDPGRVLEGVITGIGFLGAGAMFRKGSFVQGAGSAASIWVAGVIGLACGMGEIWLSGTLTAIVLAVLVVSGPFTDDYDPGDVNDG